VRTRSAVVLSLVIVTACVSPSPAWLRGRVLAQRSNRLPPSTPTGLRIVALGGIALSVSINTPTGGTAVSGTVSVAASVSDTAIAVQFKLDGGDLGAEDTSSPYSVTWNTTTAPLGLHTLTAVARDAAGNTATSEAISVTVSNVISPVWPNEPARFTTLNDQPWNLLTGNGWDYLRRTSSKDDSIISDATAPFSPLNVLRIVFTPDMSRNSEPSVHWIGLPSRPREIFTGWWMKLSPNWTPSPAGGGKITFLWAPDGQGTVYTGVFGARAPHHLSVNTEWAPYGQRIWDPNIATTLINYSQWFRIEWYMKWESTPGSSDGILRWWVNGVLNGDYGNVRYPTCCFQQFEFAPTLQNPPQAEQYMYIDHTRISVPKG
jgi:Big-like domain-containing protein